MRPLAMDFRTDVRAQNIGDQFMFGPAILVNPVTEPGATSRDIYLPKAKWYDFWTGHAVDGGDDGRRRRAARPHSAVRSRRFDRPDGTGRASTPPRSRRIPSNCAFMRARTAVSLSTKTRTTTTTTKKARTRRFRSHWDDAAHTLTIGERQGHFPGMLENRNVPCRVCRRKPRSRHRSRRPRSRIKSWNIPANRSRSSANPFPTQWTWQRMPLRNLSGGSQCRVFLRIEVFCRSCSP